MFDKMLVELGAWYSNVFGKALQCAGSLDEVHQGGESQEGHDYQVADGFHRETESPRSLKELADDSGNKVSNPEQDSQNNG